MNRVERKINILQDEVLKKSIELSSALQKLSIVASDILGFEVQADICGGFEIEFRKVLEDGVADSYDTIRLEDIVANIQKHKSSKA